MRLVDGPSGRTAEEDQDYDDDYEETPLYTDEEYAELEEAFGRTAEEDQDYDDDYEDTPLYTDEEYEELEGAFEN